MKRLPILCMFVVMTLAVFLQNPAKAEAAETRTTPLDLSSATEDMSNADEGWAWDNATKTLTLEQIDFKLGYEDAILLPQENCTICLKGTNNISTEWSAFSASGEKAYSGQYIVTGNTSARLNITDAGYAFWLSGDLEIRNVTLSVTANQFSAGRKLIFNNCAVTVKGAEKVYWPQYALISAEVNENLGMTGTASISMKNCYVKTGGAVLKKSTKLSYIGINSDNCALTTVIARGTAPKVKTAAITRFAKNYKNLDLYWSVPAYSNGKFVVYRSTKKTSGFKAVATVYDAHYHDTGLTFNKAYYYYIKSYNSQGSTKSAVKGAITGLAKVQNAQYGRGKYYDGLDWQKVSGATGYRIYRSTSTKGTYKLIKTVGNTNSYTYKRPSAKTVYFYKICAIRKVGSKVYTGPLSRVDPEDEG